MKKKKKLTSKERKRLLDEEMAQRGIDPDARRQRSGSGVGKMAWLSSVRSEADAKKAFVQLLIESRPLADEPELADLFFDPTQSIDALAETATELGFEIEGDDSPEWDISEDTQLEVQARVVKKLLTRHRQRRFEDAVARLVKRLKKTQDTEKFVSASAVEAFMKTIKDPSGWAAVGLVDEIVQRSLDAGFKLLDSVDEQISEDQSTGDIIQSLSESKVAEFTSFMGKIPSLRSYLEKAADAIWDEGLKAVESGECDLGLFSPEELQGGIEIMIEVPRPQLDGIRAEGDNYQPTLTDEQGKILITHLEEYITEVFTPERLDQLKAHLDSYLSEPGDNRPHLAFISLVHLRMQEENAVENEMPLLMRVFFQEFYSYGQSITSREE